MALQVQPAQATENGLVLAGPAHDLRGRGQAPPGAQQGKPDGLRSRRCEDDLGRLDSEGCRGDIARPVESGAGVATFSVGAGGVPRRQAGERARNLGELGSAGREVEVGAFEVSDVES